MRPILPIFVIASLGACAASERLADHPRRHIDRPSTLPCGVASWTTTMFAAIHEEDGERDASVLPPLPIFWQYGLRDRWSLSGAFQVKSGAGKGLTSQVIRTEAINGLPTIGFGFNLGPTIVRDMNRLGLLVTRSLDDLLAVIRP